MPQSSSRLKQNQAANGAGQSTSAGADAPGGGRCGEAYEGAHAASGLFGPARGLPILRLRMRLRTESGRAFRAPAGSRKRANRSDSRLQRLIKLRLTRRNSLKGKSLPPTRNLLRMQRAHHLRPMRPNVDWNVAAQIGAPGRTGQQLECCARWRRRCCGINGLVWRWSQQASSRGRRARVWRLRRGWRRRERCRRPPRLRMPLRPESARCLHSI